MRVADDGQVRQRKGVKSDEELPPVERKGSGRSFWLVAGATSCCAIWWLVCAVGALLFISVPPEASTFEYYSAVSTYYSRLEYSKEVLNFLPRIPFPDVGAAIFNKIRRPYGDEYFRMYSQGPHTNGGGCEDLHGIQREFCNVSIGEGSVKNFKKYEGLREKCQWRSDDAFDASSFIYLNFSDADMRRESGYTHFSYEQTQKWINAHRGRKAPHRVQSKVCEFKENKVWEWKIIRVGPFYSNGGYDWHRYLIPNSTEIGHKLYSGFFYGPVDGDGKVLGYPPIHIHHMHSATTQCNLIGRIWNGGVPDPLFAKQQSTQWYFDLHGDRQCKSDQGGTACLHKELPEGYAEYIYLPQCIFGEVNDVRPPNSPTMEFWLEHAYRFTKYHERARPTGFFASGAGSHVHVEEGVSPANAVMGAFAHQAAYKPQLYPVDDYDAPSDEDSVIWCTVEVPFDLEFVSVWLHTHHQFTYDMLWFRSHPRALGLDSPPLVMENHHSPLRLPKTGIDRHQLKRYLYNNMDANGAEVACKLNEDRFQKGEPGVLPKGSKNDIYDRFVMPNCSEDLSFKAGDLITMLAIHGPVTGKVTKSNISVMHMGWYAQYVRPGCEKLQSCARQDKLVDDLHISCLEATASPRAVAIGLAEQHLQNTRDNVAKVRKQLASFARQGGGLW